MQLDDTPLQPGRSYLCRIRAIERRMKVTRIRLRQGRWFALGVDLDRQTACTIWVDEAESLRPCHAG